MQHKTEHRIQYEKESEGKKIATIAIGISPKAGGGATTQVPVSALEEDGVPPEEGDSVSFSVEGKVQSVDGNTATVSIDSINGEPLGDESSEGSEEDEGQPPATGAQPGGGAQPPVQASGPSDTLGPMGKGLAPRRAASPSANPFPAANLARNRIDRAGNNALRAKLLGAARKTPPF